MVEFFNEVNWALIAPLLILDILLKVIAVIAWVRHRSDSHVSWLWLPIILFVSLVGPMIYFIFGRRETY